MSALVRRRARIARVRHVQHLQASAVAAAAEERVASLENTSDRLLRLATSLTPAQGPALGAALRSANELAMRLDAARDGLTKAVAGARATLVQTAALRLEARIRQESAERLGALARAERDALAERRVPPHRAPRSRFGEAPE